MASTLLACPISPGACGCAPPLLIGAVGWPGTGLVSQVDAGARGAGATDGWGRAGARGLRSPARLHELAGGPCWPISARRCRCRGDPGGCSSAARQVRAGRRVGGGRPGRTGPRLRRPAPAQATASWSAWRSRWSSGWVAGGPDAPLVSAHAVRQYWWVLPVIPLAAACLYPPSSKFGLDRVLRVLGRAPLEVRSAGAAWPGTGLDTLGWLCYGAHAWFLISVFAKEGGRGGGRVATPLPCRSAATRWPGRSAS